MRIGKKGTASDAFVQEVWYEGVPVSSVWYEGVKLYPDERTFVRDLVLGGADDVFWVHLQEALRLGRDGLRLTMTLNGRSFHLGSGDGSLPVLRYVGGAWRADEADGLKLADYLGAEVVLHASVPERTFALDVPVLTNGSDVCELEVLPVLDGTRVRWRQWGNKRRTDGYGYVRAASKASGEVFCQVNSWTSGRTERAQVFALSGGPLVDSGSILRVWYVCTRYSGGTKAYSIVYPAFEREWRLRVLGCTLQRRK